MATWGQQGAGGAPPGWYADPWRVAPYRWFDGTAWSAATWPPATAAPGTPPGQPTWSPTAGAAPVRPSPPSPALVRWVRAGVVAYPVAQLGQQLAYATQAGTIRRSFDDWRTAVQAAQDQGTQVPTLHLSASVTAAYPLGLVAIAALVVGLVWQHRAATAARAAGWPATHSPGFGVGAWFIPVVNLWMPYQALRDLLPPGHPGRRRLLLAWIAALAAGIIGAAGVVAAFLSGVVAAVLLVVAAGAWAVVVVLAWRHLDAVDAALADAQAAQGGWQTSQA